MYGHLESKTSNNLIDVHVEHPDIMRVSYPLERKQRLSPFLTNNGEEMSVLEAMKVDRMLDPNTIVIENYILSSVGLLEVKTLHMKIIQVKKTLEWNALYGLG